MSYDVIFTATARRDLQRIPPRITPAIIEFAFGDLAARVEAASAFPLAPPASGAQPRDVIDRVIAALALSLWT